MKDRSSTASVDPNRFVSRSTSIIRGSLYEVPGVALAQHRDEDRPLARTVELAEEDALPGPECESTVVAKRDDDAGAHQAGADVRRGVLLARLDVLPRPAVFDHTLERCLEVARDCRIRVLVDRDAGGGMWHVDEHGGAGLTCDGIAHPLRDVEELAPPLRPESNLVHG